MFQLQMIMSLALWGGKACGRYVFYSEHAPVEASDCLLWCVSIYVCMNVFGFNFLSVRDVSLQCRKRG